MERLDLQIEAGRWTGGWIKEWRGKAKRSFYMHMESVIYVDRWLYREILEIGELRRKHG